MKLSIHLSFLFIILLCISCNEERISVKNTEKIVPQNPAVKEIDDIALLIAEINKKTDNRWNIYVSKTELGITAKKQFIGKVHSPCGPCTFLHSKQTYELTFTLEDKIDPAKYKETFESKQKEFSSLLKKAKKEIKHENMKGSWFFYPQNKDEIKLYQKYDRAKEDFRTLPEYYYKNIALRCTSDYRHYSAKDEKDKTYTEVLSDVKKIFSILKKYK